MKKFSAFRKTFVVVLVLALGLGLTSVNAQQTTNWTGSAGDGLWTTAGNWNNGVPISATNTTVQFNNGGSGYTSLLSRR